MPNPKPRKFEGVPATACHGIENFKETFGLGNDKEAISAAFEAGTDGNQGNLLFGSSGIVTRTLDHWKDLLDEAFKLIESLRAELFKSRAETQKALAEKEKAESERLHAALKLDGVLAELEAERNASKARAKVRREREVSDAFAEVDRAHRMRSAAKGIATKLHSLSPGKTPLERLKARRTPFNPTGLTRERARRERCASRAKGATDSTALHRSTSMRRRDKTLPLLNEYVAEAGPLHLPGVECPPESDTKAYNDYKAKVSVCVCVCPRARTHRARVLACARARATRAFARVLTPRWARR